MLTIVLSILMLLALTPSAQASELVMELIVTESEFPTTDPFAPRVGDEAVAKAPYDPSPADASSLVLSELKLMWPTGEMICQNASAELRATVRDSHDPRYGYDSFTISGGLGPFEDLSCAVDTPAGVVEAPGSLQLGVDDKDATVWSDSLLPLSFPPIHEFENRGPQTNFVTLHIDSNPQVFARVTSVEVVPEPSRSQSSIVALGVVVALGISLRT